MLSFYEWLHTQKDRPDTAGLMANDAINDPDFPRGAAEQADVIDYLQSKNAASGVLRVSRYLWETWEYEVREVA